MRVRVLSNTAKKRLEIKCGFNFTITNCEDCSFITIYNDRHKLWINNPDDAKDIVRGLVRAIKELTGEVYTGGCNEKR